MLSPGLSDSLIRHYKISFSFISSVYNSTSSVLTGLYAVIHRFIARVADTGEVELDRVAVDIIADQDVHIDKSPVWISHHGIVLCKVTYFSSQI